MYLSIFATQFLNMLQRAPIVLILCVFGLGISGLQAQITGTQQIIGQTDDNTIKVYDPIDFKKDFELVP